MLDKEFDFNGIRIFTKDDHRYMDVGDRMKEKLEKICPNLNIKLNTKHIYNVGKYYYLEILSSYKDENSQTKEWLIRCLEYLYKITTRTYNNDIFERFVSS